VRRGHQVAVATLSHGGLATTEVKDGVTIYRLRGTAQHFGRLFKSEHRRWAPPIVDPGIVTQMLGVLRREKPQIVHGHDWLARSFVPLKAAAGARFIVSLHYYTQVCAKKDLLRAQQPCSGPALTKCCTCAAKHYGLAKGLVTAGGNSFGAYSERWAADHFIAVSQSVASKNYLDTCGRPYSVVPNFVAEGRQASTSSRSYLRQLPKEPYILFVGDIRAYKGINVLLRAYAKLQQPPPLVLIGKLWPESPRTFPPGVHVITECPNEAVRKAWDRALFGVVPSIGPEAFGLVAIEALASGKPVVASCIGGLPEIVRPDINGLLVQPNDVQSLTSALRRLIDDADFRRQLADGAQRSAAEFRASTVVPRIEDIYGMH
jgi:glycosyltransferase involved in cell wall biosynthesis